MPLCLGSLLKPKAVTKPIVDLDKLIQDSAWDLVDYPVLCCMRETCKQKDLYLHVDWTYMSREDKVTKFQIHPDLSGSGPFQNMCLFETKFQNNSILDQQFTFKTSRQTVSTFEICVQEGLCIGGNFNFSFSMPSGKIGGAGGEDVKLSTATLGGHVTWSGAVGEKLTKSETLTWGIDSQVTVGGRECVVAQLGVREAHFMADLELETTMTVTTPSGGIPIDVRDRKTEKLVDVVHLVPRDLCEDHDKLIFDDTKGSTHQFRFHNTALCNAVYGVDQFVSVTPIGHRGPNLQELPCGLETLRSVAAPLASMDSVATSN